MQQDLSAGLGGLAAEETASGKESISGAVWRVEVMKI